MAASRKFFTITAACASTVFAGRTAAQSSRASFRPDHAFSRSSPAAPLTVPLENEEATASALERLAETAGLFGDDETMLRATFQAALLYEYLDNPERVKALLPGIRSLLKSPAISDEMRREVASRMARR